MWSGSLASARRPSCGSLFGDMACFLTGFVAHCLKTTTIKPVGKVSVWFPEALCFAALGPRARGQRAAAADGMLSTNVGLLKMAPVPPVSPPHQFMMSGFDKARCSKEDVLSSPAQARRTNA